MSLLKSLILVSEKAAGIARLCRSDEHLFSLLIEEKKQDEANPRFVQDFKTLADVLIQETVRHDIGVKFPGIRGRIQGEESNVFCNILGERICVEVLGSEDETAELLAKVLDGDHSAAQHLAKEVHTDIKLEDVNTDGVVEIDSELDVDIENFGIWIDPIDSTAEYIRGKEELGENDIAISGLKCVTVLIGVYDLITGLPVMGIVNQPFAEVDKSNRWRGYCHWGISTSSITSLGTISPKITNVICISSSENDSIKEKLSNSGFTLVEAAGAGYKILTTIIGLADAYVLSKDSTFKWDTCGPQAILRSLGGDIITFNDLIHDNITSVNYNHEKSSRSVQSHISTINQDVSFPKNTDSININCNEENSIDFTANENSAGEELSKIKKCCNLGGIVAYRNTDVLSKIRKTLKD